MSNAAAVEVTIEALKGEGRLGPADEAFIAAARTTAEALDLDPGNAALVREYTGLLVKLATVGSGQGDDDAQAFLRLVSTPVRDTTGPDPGVPGAGGRRRGGRAGSTVDAVATAGRGRRARATS